jgi:hypothetical protein
MADVAKAYRSVSRTAPSPAGDYQIFTNARLRATGG